MKRQQNIMTALALSILLSSSVLAQQPPNVGPPPDLAARVRAYQDKLFKEEYGFSDKQVALYHKKDDAIKAAYEKKMEALRKQVPKSSPAKKRELYKQIYALEDERDVERHKSLLSIATPTQQAKIKAKMPKQQ